MFCPGTQKKAADADFNGTIEVADARLILRVAVGLEETFGLLKHNFVEADVVPATCSENGTRTLKCSDCGETKTEELPITHTFVRNICINCHATEIFQDEYNKKNGYTKVSGQITYQ